MRRREFIGLAGGAAAWPAVGRAQQAKMPVVGYLASTSGLAEKGRLEALRKGLSQGGFMEGVNVRIEYRWAENQIDRLSALANELVEKRVDVIITSAIRATLAAKAATTTIPIVFATANDPIKFGLVGRMNRPDGNLTGITWLTASLGPKRLEILHNLVPGARLIGILANSNNANVAENLEEAAAAAKSLGLGIEVGMVKSANEFEAAISALLRSGCQCLLVLNDPMFLDQRISLLKAVQNHRLPAIYPDREYVDDGGLASYGASISDAHRQAGEYAGRILMGQKPADLPVLQPTKFEFVINGRTAQSLSLAVPVSLEVFADEIIN